MDERDTQDPLRDLGRRLDRARHGRDRPAASSPAASGAGGFNSALGLALRIGVELVVAVIVGVAIGWALDRWLGTRPWGMILFFFLGIAAGMVNVYRTVTGMAIGYRRGAQASPPPKTEANWSDEDED